VINVPDSLDICPDTLGYTRILRIFTRIVWKATFFWHFRWDRSDRSVWPVWPVQPGNFPFYPFLGLNCQNTSHFTILPPTATPFTRALPPSPSPTPLEIWSSSPRFDRFIMCIGARRGGLAIGAVDFEVLHEFPTLLRYQMFLMPDLLAPRIFFWFLWSSSSC